ncbi:MAG TPA: DUF4956 domain-containing protein [Gemmatimonadales bacterium]|nr:DUF4956 domain-containing protein [Gemmatimonadales bacterium]
MDATNRSLLRLLLYYVVLVGGTLVLERYSPAVRQAVSFEVPNGITAGQLRQTLETGVQPAASEALPAHRRAALSTALAMIGALLLVIPVAWVYMLSKRRQRWDASVVQTVILLPLVVAGIAALVRNSLALAFSLAGLAAAVRFRNTLKDTKDAVYVFLAIAVGLAAGVQALELAFVVSVVFNVAVLALWALNVGDIYAGEPRPTFTQEFRIAEPDRPDGTLRVQVVGGVQQLVEAALHDHVRSWRVTERAPGEGGRMSLAYLVQLKKKTTAEALVAVVSALGATAEFVPFQA